jgi:hypothetical protein
MREELLALMTSTVRFATADQLTLIFFGAASVRPSINRLVEEGWLDSASLALKRPRLERPLMSDADPVCMVPSVAYWLEQRWANTEPEVLRIYWATKKAAQFYSGEFFGVKQPLQIEHDLLVLDAVAHHRTEGVAITWHTEDELREVAGEFSGKVPDAMVSNGLDWTVVEIGGRYSPERLTEFVTAMNRKNLAFEVW